MTTRESQFSSRFRRAFGVRLWLLRLLLPGGHAIWTWGLNDGEDEPIFVKELPRGR